MDKKTWYYVGAAVIVVILLVLANRNKPASAPSNSKASGNQQASTAESNQPLDATPTTPSIKGDYWEGTLKASDNAKKGNYMLVTDKNTVYINTSRDFSSLIGQKVKVGYEGTLDSFRLGDIVAE